MAKRYLTTGAIDSDSLCTPPEIYEPMYELFGGHPDCDPATNEYALIEARVKYTEFGLTRPWGRRTWVNWPYSNNDPWSRKSIYEMAVGNAREMLVLCMSATSTAWWSGMMHKPRRNPDVMCTKRIRFYDSSRKPMKHTAQFDTALIYYGTKSAKFRRLFKHVANWTTRGR